MAFFSLKAELKYMVLRVLGSNADMVVSKLEAAEDSKEALERTLDQCIKLVSLTIDEKKATELRQRCQDILRRH